MVRHYLKRGFKSLKNSIKNDINVYVLKSILNTLKKYDNNLFLIMYSDLIERYENEFNLSHEKAEIFVEYDLAYVGWSKDHNPLFYGAENL